MGLEAPRLRRIDIPSVASFLKPRREYEAQITEKKEQSGGSIRAISYKNSVEARVQKMRWRRKFLTAASTEAISEEQLKACLEERAKVYFIGLLKEDWDRIVKNVKLNVSNSDARCRVSQLIIDYEDALEAEGYHGGLESCPEIPMSHIRTRTLPGRLRKHMEDLVKMRSKDRLQKKDFFEYVETVVDEAILVEKVGRNEAREHTGNVDDDDASGCNTPSHNSGKGNKHNRDQKMIRRRMAPISPGWETQARSLNSHLALMQS